MDAIERHRCDASPSEKAVATIYIGNPPRPLYACRHHLRDWTETLEAMGGEFETVETEAVEA